MAKLYLVRHAQASFGFENYDQLSELGLKQSAYIPIHFKDQQDDKQHILYSGSMVRHKQTAEKAFGNLIPFINPGLNEFDHENVIKVSRPEIADKEKAMALIATQSDPKKFLEDEFEIAMLKWINEEGTTSYKESFKDFKSRSLDALQQITATARKEKQKEVVAITSGGFISFIVVHVLGIPYEKMISLNMNIANTSITGLIFNDNKITLRYLNNYSHLPQEMVTFI